MKNFFRLLIVAGLLIAGWLNRDVLNGLRAKATTLDDREPEAVPAAPAPAPAARTSPHPATEAKAAAAKAYPALAIPNSAFNKRFLSLYEEAQFREPGLLSAPDWPLKIAERTAVSLGGGAMPTPVTPVTTGRKPGSSPSGLQGSALDMRPGSKSGR